jgi:hypothetical protein
MGMKAPVFTILMILSCLCSNICMNAQIIHFEKWKISVIHFDKWEISGSKAWIFPMDTTKLNLGPVSLYELKDSSIIICEKFLVSRRNDPSVCQTLDIPVIDINKIRIRDKRKASNRMGIVLLICTATGFGIGYLSGYSRGDDQQFSADTYGVVAGMFGAVCGAVCGAIPGAIIGTSFKVNIPINGDLGNYKMNKDKIRKYSIKK